MGVFERPFVAPESARLDIGDGHWVDVKRELSYGDMQKVASRSRADLTLSDLNLVAAYLLDWSLLDERGQPVPVDTDAAKGAALQALSLPAFRAIADAIDTHVQAVVAAKKPQAPSGAKKSGKRLSSVV